MRFLLILVGAAAMFAASAQATPPSGLRGLVTKGPTTPVCRAGELCSAPAKHVQLRFVRNGVAHVTTSGEDGRYRIVLAPGIYVLRVPSARGGANPGTVSVHRSVIGVLNISIDTGIR